MMSTSAQFITEWYELVGRNRPRRVYSGYKVKRDTRFEAGRRERNVETSPTRNSKYSGVVESERKRSRATVRRHVAYSERDPGPRTHTPRFIDSFTIPSRPSTPRSGESASLCVAIIYSIRARKTAPRSHRVINRGEHC